MKSHSRQCFLKSVPKMIRITWLFTCLKLSFQDPKIGYEILTSEGRIGNQQYHNIPRVILTQSSRTTTIF